MKEIKPKKKNKELIEQAADKLACILYMQIEKRKRSKKEKLKL